MRTALPRRPSATPAAALLACLCALSLVAPGPAAGAPYEVYSCQGPSGEALPGTAWTASTSGDGAVASAECAGGMRAALPAGRASTRATGSLTFTAPPGTRITDFELSRTLRASVGGVFSSGYVAALSSVDPAGPLGPGCSGAGLSVPSTCEVGEPSAAGSGVSVGGRGVSAAGTQESCPALTPAAEATVARSRVVLDDAQGPRISGTSGTLGDPDRVARTVTVATSDLGGGVASITANVDGGAAATARSGGGCAPPYATAQPCPTTRDVTFGVDTGPLRPGDHVATGTVVDAAGTSMPWGPVPFAVSEESSSDPGPLPAGAVPVPVSAATTPDGAPVPTARLTLQGESTKDGRRRPTGYLRTLGGTPLANVAVRLTRTRTGADAPGTVPMAAVRTGRDGRFAAEPLPEGAWTVAGAADVSSGTVTDSVRLRTRLRLTAAPSPTRLRTGGLMVLSGRLSGAGPARAGVRVRIQTVIRGRYRTVAAVRTSATGRWRWRHRFTKVSRPTLFAFRAVVPGEGDDWPWGPVSRRAKTVRVDPR